MLNESDLREQNPWWDVPRSIVDDEAIRAWEDSAICYDPEMRRDITYDYEPSNTVIYTLYGVRQIGKTTMIKLQIRDFLDGGVRPWNLFYSFDRSSSDATLGSVVKSYLEQSRGRKAAQDRTYIFLDEVTVVPRWEKSLKGLVDAGRLKNCTVMVAGSRSDSIVGSINSILGGYA